MSVGLAGFEERAIFSAVASLERVDVLDRAIRRLVGLSEATTEEGEACSFCQGTPVARDYCALKGTAAPARRWALNPLSFWHACGPCHALVGANDRDGLAERAVQAAQRARSLRIEERRTIYHDALLQLDEFFANPRRHRPHRPA